LLAVHEPSALHGGGFQVAQQVASLASGGEKAEINPAGQVVPVGTAIALTRVRPDQYAPAWQYWDGTWHRCMDELHWPEKQSVPAIHIAPMSPKSTVVTTVEVMVLVPTLVVMLVGKAVLVTVFVTVAGT